MKLQNVQFEIRDHIAEITVNRAAARNALDLQTVNELHQAIQELSKSKDAGVGILTGAGDRVFVAGADIRDIRARTKMEGLQGINTTLFKAVEDCEKPIIAAVNGFAYGGGCELACACDIRVCSENAKFALPEVSLGILPAAGGMYRLTRIAGIGLAKEMILTGDPIDAHRAFQLGLVSKIVPAAELMNVSRLICKQILSRGPLAVRLAKRSLNVMTQVSTEAAMAMENFAQALLFESEDKAEGTTAFLEKRAPKFKGR